MRKIYTYNSPGDFFAQLTPQECTRLHQFIIAVSRLISTSAEQCELLLPRGEEFLLTSFHVGVNLLLSLQANRCLTGVYSDLAIKIQGILDAQEETSV